MLGLTPQDVGYRKDLRRARSRRLRRRVRAHHVPLGQPPPGTMRSSDKIAFAALPDLTGHSAAHAVISHRNAAWERGEGAAVPLEGLGVVYYGKCVVTVD